MDFRSDAPGCLKELFVDVVQARRIKQGQRPALRPVFHKPHGGCRAQLRVRQGLPDELKVGFLSVGDLPAWIRFSSDTAPDRPDYRSTLGVGIKLFGVPGRKLIGDPEGPTMDLLLQNHNVFFVPTAAEMCDFTRAGVIDGDYDLYIRDHPDTGRILEEMAKPVASCLGSPYWSILPFRFGPGHAVRYKLEPAEPTQPLPADPRERDYLRAELAERLSKADATFRLLLQFRTEPDSMPLDDATMAWPEELSVPLHVADLVIPRQEVDTSAGAEFTENLALNIWRVPPEHEPLGSIAASRRVAYEAAAEQRRRVNGVSTDEPSSLPAEPSAGPAADWADEIVSARIHPGIGIARIGDSDEFVIGPETVPTAASPAMRDASGALRRQAARFRVYGYNAAGQAVRELTCAEAEITWSVHVANRKADWYRFIAALDLPDAGSTRSILRNRAVTGPERSQLVIDPGPLAIEGQPGSGAVPLDGGSFKGIPVSLGELRTDPAGRLLVLSGRGRSESPSHAPLYVPEDVESFNNADDWFDDTSDGPVGATVRLAGRDLPVEGAWVVVAPPNYAPDVLGWRTLTDLLLDRYVEAGWLQRPETVRFHADVLPILARLSNLQWVNAGFAAMFGRGRPMDFEEPEFIAKLGTPPGAGGVDPYRELRQQLFNAFRPTDPKVHEPRLWPWIYGDAFGSYGEDSPRNGLALPRLQSWILDEWAEGRFALDQPPPHPGPLEDLPIDEQPTSLDHSALAYCLADAFHPGCELTWPMRHLTLYDAPFRVKRRAEGEAESDYGPVLDAPSALGENGPLHAQPPGGLSRWMAIPWQGDTAFCRSGYEPEFDPFLPTFWPARVPNQVLSEESYRIVVDEARPREERIAAYNNRAHWLRAIDGKDVTLVMQRMIDRFAEMGVVERRPGVPDDPDLPAVMWVENIPDYLADRLVAAGLTAGLAPPSRDPVERAGWEDSEHLRAFRAVRLRDR